MLQEKKAGGNIKKILIGLMSVAIVFILSGCDITGWLPNFGYHPYVGERPYDYPAARWKSETPDFWFDTNLSDTDEYMILKGELTYDDNSVEVLVDFGFTDDIHIRENKSNAELRGLSGHCKFSPEKLVVTVDKETDTLLNGQYDTITFIRCDSY